MKNSRQRGKMNCHIYSLLLLMIFAGCLICICEPIPQDFSSQERIKIQDHKNIYVTRFQDWMEYISRPNIRLSSQSQVRFINQPFEKLLEIGPVIVPWLVAEDRSLFIRTAIDILTRCRWTEFTGLSEHEILYGDNTRNLFDKWWPIICQNSSKFTEERIAKFKLRSAAMSGKAVRQIPEWDKLKNMGVFGIPYIVQRIKAGQPNEYDFRLLNYWTEPLNTENRWGMIQVSPEKEILPSEKANGRFWLEWWQDNKWQFWWIRDAR